VNTEETKNALTTLTTEAQNLFNSIAGRLTITSISLDNGTYDSTKLGNIYTLGYGVVINVNANNSYKIVAEGEETRDATTEDTESIVMDFLDGETSLGTLTFRGKPGEGKYTPAATTSGTFDVFGDYESTSWAKAWSGNSITDIPTKVKVTVKYNDGRIVEQNKDLPEDFDITPFYVEALNRTETVEDMSRAIINLESVAENNYKFTNLSRDDKEEVAKMVFDERNEAEGIKDIPNTAGKFFNENKLDASYVIGKVNGHITARENFINAVNGVVIANEAPNSISAMIDVLAGEDTLIPEFAKLSAADQAEKAELVLNALRALNADGEKFETIAQIREAAGL